ncbi:OLC1v1004769C1 [Oldenlandia corymbosa var. corymbosa]|uniref:OLC1v1004769C1 n=1 Tax=Oldenlandia corymbosa var. corymbosa TaxID=529605 RepID=A0AAV1DD44_OLDCO|nr:OLC1v1004769C1 [Oldenlandia corymbosa var. corymbosa]
MEITSANQEKMGFFCRVSCWFKALWEKIVSKIVEVGRDTKSLGKEDPRRIIHSVKVGLAIALVSLGYYFDPIYEGFGVSAMWAVITVVVVFDFSVGGTIGRAMNRGIATLIGGFLGVGVHRLATCFDIKALIPIIIALSIFIIAAIGTFARFFPKSKARYDYGLLIFILTFCLICVSGYRDDEVLDIALTRLSTIFVGGGATVLVCVLVFPVWAGQDLHNLVADNIERIGSFLEGFGEEYFKVMEDENAKDKKALLNEHKPVLTSKNIEDALINSAKWEPRHGKFRFRHPWGQYQKIGSQTRELGYRLDALKGYLNAEMQSNPEIRANFEESCKKMSYESSHALKKLAAGIRTMTLKSSTKAHIADAKAAANELKSLLKTNPWQHHDLLEVIPVASVASLLVETVCCTIKIAEAVHELASLAKFKAEDDATKPDEQEVTKSFMRTPSIEASHGLQVMVE